MQISSYIKIQNLNQIDSMSSNSLLMTGLDDEAYISKTISYGKLSAQIFSEISSQLANAIWRDISAKIEHDYNLATSSISAQVSANTESIQQLSNNLGSCMMSVDLINSFAEDTKTGLDDLYSFTHGIVVSSILKIANCQLSVRRDLNDLKTDLSVEII